MSRSVMRGVAAMGAALLGVVLAAPCALASTSVIDGFETIEGWTATASEGAQVWLAQEPGRTGQALRIDYDLGNGSGYVIVRKTFAFSVPTNFAFTFDLLGEGQPNNFEMKLVDPSDRNVWWWRKHDFAWPTSWQAMAVRRSRLELAWGATPNVKLQKVGAIEFAITAGEGGSGAVWVDELGIEERPVPASDGGTPTATASSSMAGYDPGRAVDGTNGGWRSASVLEDQWIALDFGVSSEYGGLIVDWDPDDWATAFDVEASTDGTSWSKVHATEHGTGARDYLYLPDSESRFLRLALHRSSRGQGYGIRALRVQPIDFSFSPNRFFEHVAREERRGLFPKYFYGEQSYWTVVGAENDDKEALLNEEGTLEVDRAGFSIEPFLWLDGRLVTWNDVERTQSLEEGYL